MLLTSPSYIPTQLLSGKLSKTISLNQHQLCQYHKLYIILFRFHRILKMVQHRRTLKSLLPLLPLSLCLLSTHSNLALCSTSTSAVLRPQLTQRQPVATPFPLTLPTPSFSPATLLRGTITLTFGDSEYFETTSGTGVPMMRRKCVQPMQLDRIASTYLSPELRSCMTLCLAPLIGRPCNQSNWSQWAYNHPTSNFCAESKCSATRTNLPIRFIDSPSQTGTVPLYISSITISPTKSAAPSASSSPIIDNGSSTPTPSPVRLPEDFILSDKKAPNETALVVGNIVEVEIERLLDSEPGTVGSDVRTEVRIRTRDSTTVVSRLSITGVAARTQSNCLPGKNCRVEVIVWSDTGLEKELIRKATVKLQDSAQFKNIFKIKKRNRTIKIKRKQRGKKYILIVKFASKYLKNLF